MCGYIAILSQQKIDILGNAGKEQEIKLSEVAKSVRVIPLETTEECLLGTDLKIYYGEEYIFVCDQRQPGAFYRFSKDGKFLNKIGCSGEGPEEYIRSLSFSVDEDKKSFGWLIVEETTLLFTRMMENLCVKYLFIMLILIKWC